MSQANMIRVKEVFRALNYCTARPEPCQKKVIHGVDHDGCVKVQDTFTEAVYLETNEPYKQRHSSGDNMTQTRTIYDVRSPVNALHV